MNTSDMAGILGLLIGGGAGYFGGQRRAAREEEMIDKLLATQADDVDPVEDLVASITTGGDDGSYIGHPGRETMAMNPYALGQGDTNLVPKEEEQGLFPTIYDYFFPDVNEITSNPYDDTIFNEGGIVPKRGLVDEPGGYAGEKMSYKDRLKKIANPFALEGMLAYPTMYNALDYGASLLPGITGLFNKGGRVGMQVGGVPNPYANLGYSFQNNIFSPTGMTAAPGGQLTSMGTNTGFQTFQDGLTELDIPETQTAPDPMQTPVPILPPVEVGGYGRDLREQQRQAQLQSSYDVNPDGTVTYEPSPLRQSFGFDTFTADPFNLDSREDLGLPGFAEGENDYGFTNNFGMTDEYGRLRQIQPGPLAMMGITGLADEVKDFSIPGMLENLFGATTNFFKTKEEKQALEDAKKATELDAKQTFQGTKYETIAQKQQAMDDFAAAEEAKYQAEQQRIAEEEAAKQAKIQAEIDAANQKAAAEVKAKQMADARAARQAASTAAARDQRVRDSQKALNDRVRQFNSNPSNQRAGLGMTATGDTYSTRSFSQKQRDRNRQNNRGVGRKASRGDRGRASRGRTGGGFCFDPNTLVKMFDGSEKKIKDIKLGDNTKGGEVTGVFQFKASDEIHDYKGVTVAGSHYVKEGGKFIMVQDSPISVKIDKIPVVHSLDTTGRRIFIKDIEFADYNGDGIAKGFLENAGVDLSGFDQEVLRQVEHRLI